MIRPLVQVALLLVLLLPSAGNAGRESISQRVKVMTAPAMTGRGSGTTGLEAAADTIAAWFESLGLQPLFGSAWDQEFPLSGHGFSGEPLEGLTARNVGALLPGQGALAERYVVVGAHYDHLGMVAPGTEPEGDPPPENYYPGANDNASGVAILFEMAAAAAAADSLPVRSILFVCFAAEEVGLQGSAFMVDHMPVPLDLVDAMINLDTVGQMPGGRLHVSGLGTTPAFAGLVESARHDDLGLSLAPGGWSGSDHMSFNTREIPVLFLFGGAYPQYNRTTDRWPTLDVMGMSRITTFANALLAGVARFPGAMPWVMVGTKDVPAQGDDSATANLNRDTWLGTLPDFTIESEGYQLAGVFDDSPAARAGLEKGDVLVLLGGLPVVDLATFTTALRSCDPGDLVEIKLLRAGRSLNYTVVLGSRSDRK